MVKKEITKRLSDSQYDHIMCVLMELKEGQGATNEHLKHINGTVEKHGMDISKLKSFVYKAIGGLTVGLIVLQEILQPVGI